jgi:hypothetical protein
LIVILLKRLVSHGELGKVSAQVPAIFGSEAAGIILPSISIGASES